MSFKQQLEEENRPFANFGVKWLMDSWVLQMNYPVVTVTRVGADGIRFSQRRFLLDPDATDPGKYQSPFK